MAIRPQLEDAARTRRPLVLLRPSRLDALRVKSWVGHPHLAELNPALSVVRLGGDDPNVIELLHTLGLRCDFLAGLGEEGRQIDARKWLELATYLAEVQLYISRAPLVHLPHYGRFLHGHQSDR